VYNGVTGSGFANMASSKLFVRSSNDYIGVGTNNPLASLHVTSFSNPTTGGNMIAGPIGSVSGAGAIMSSGSNNGFYFVNRSLTTYPKIPAAGDYYPWYANNGSAALYTPVTGNILYADNTGKIGIGTNLPLSKLDINSNSTNGLHISVDNTTNTGGQWDGINMDINQTADYGRGIGINVNRDLSAAIAVANTSSSPAVSAFEAWGNGYVYCKKMGIGYRDFYSSYALQVCGSIRAKEVDVDGSSWCDYVFDKDYKMASLDELDNYIKANHHLPEIPTTAEVEKEGIKIGKMTALLLKKTEEGHSGILKCRNW
jgi:hypothetical protein